MEFPQSGGIRFFSVRPIEINIAKAATIPAIKKKIARMLLSNSIDMRFAFFPELRRAPVNPAGSWAPPW